MKRAFTSLLLMVVSLSVLACSGTATPTPTPGVEFRAPATPISTATETTTPEVAMVRIGKGPSGDILVDSRGFSLYVFKNDTAGSGTSACTGACMNLWPPLLISASSSSGAPVSPTKGAGVSGDLGTISRPDATKQLSYNGKPLYRYASDTATGDTKGASIPNWSLATP